MELEPEKHFRNNEPGKNKTDVRREITYYKAPQQGGEENKTRPKSGDSLL